MNSSNYHISNKKNLTLRNLLYFDASIRSQSCANCYVIIPRKTSLSPFKLIGSLISMLTVSSVEEITSVIINYNKKQHKRVADSY